MFGVKGFAHIDKTKRSKFDSKAYPCVFLGYSDTTRGYRVWNVKAKKVEVVRTAKFQEAPKTHFVQIVHHSEPQVIVQEDDTNDDRPQRVHHFPSQPPVQAANDEMDLDEDMFVPGHEEEKEEDQLVEPTADPAFDIDDVYMEEGLEEETDATDIVPRGRFDHPSPVFAPCSGNSVAMLPPKCQLTSPRARPYVSRNRAPRPF